MLTPYLSVCPGSLTWDFEVINKYWGTCTHCRGTYMTGIGYKQYGDKVGAIQQHLLSIPKNWL